MRRRFGRDPLANPEPLIERVYAYVTYRIGDRLESEDLTSETFERALRYRSTYDPAKGDPAAWLVGIARRVIADAAARAQAAPLARDDTPDLPADGDLEHDTVRRLSLAAVVETLNEHDRELISLRYGADLTASQIASVLGMRTNAVEVALHRALGRIRARLGDESGAPSRATTQ